MSKALSAQAPADARVSGLLGGMLALVRRDLRIGVRSAGQWLNPLLFFVIVVTLFPLGIGPSPERLEAIAPGVLWVAALLSVLLSLDTLFERDRADGVLEQQVLGRLPLSLVVLARVIAHWLLGGLPLLLLSPLLAVLLGLPGAAIPTLLASLALGTVTLSLVGAIGAGLTLGVNRGGILLSLLVLPLTVPVLIFGAGAVSAAAAGYSPAAGLSLLAALAMLALSLGPLAAAAAVRVGIGTAGQG